MSYVWTDQKPTVPGYWWFRGAPYESSEDWCVFQVWEEEGLFSVSYKDQPVDEMMKKWPHGQWAGPIEEPKEA